MDWPTEELHAGDCLAYMRTMPAESVDLIATDPPYYKVKDEAWDRQWRTSDKFLAWVGELGDEWRRVLKPNGSLYVFASPRMATAVEVELSKRFTVLNRIVWNKSGANSRQDTARWKQARKEDLRAWWPASEHIIFAEHQGADNQAKGLAGYATKCAELRGFVFEPLRAYLAGEWRRAGLKSREANEATGTFMAGHYFTASQWALPTEEHYRVLQAYANKHGRRPAPAWEDFHEAPRERFERAGGAGPAGDYLPEGYAYLQADYESLRADYEFLRADFEELRRPFSVTADVPYTDVWEFQAVPWRPGRHPCEKPLDMMRHIVAASSKPGALVFDPFVGSGTTWAAAILEGRRFLGCEMSERHAAEARARAAATRGEVGTAADAQAADLPAGTAVPMLLPGL